MRSSPRSDERAQPARWAGVAAGALSRVHRDERGTISVLTVIILLVFTMILGMIINVGREIDDKIKLQDASDASTYSAGVVVARGMNAVAFTNHLLCEVFGMTAYLREGRDRGAEQMVPDILAAWSKIGPIFSGAEFQKFQDFGPAITEKVPLEQEVVTAFSEMTAIKSQVMLPALEYILGQPESMGGDPGNAFDSPIPAGRGADGAARRPGDDAGDRRPPRTAGPGSPIAGAGGRVLAVAGHGRW